MCTVWSGAVPLTMSHLAFTSSVWKRANSLLSWMVVKSFHTSSSTSPKSTMEPDTRAVMSTTSGPEGHSERVGESQVKHRRGPLQGTHSEATNTKPSAQFEYCLCLNHFVVIREFQCDTFGKSQNQFPESEDKIFPCRNIIYNIL